MIIKNTSYLLLCFSMQLVFANSSSGYHGEEFYRWINMPWQEFKSNCESSGPYYGNVRYTYAFEKEAVASNFVEQFRDDELTDDYKSLLESIPSLKTIDKYDECSQKSFNSFKKALREVSVIDEYMAHKVNLKMSLKSNIEKCDRQKYFFEDSLNIERDRTIDSAKKVYEISVKNIENDSQLVNLKEKQTQIVDSIIGKYNAERRSLQLKYENEVAALKQKNYLNAKAKIDLKYSTLSNNIERDYNSAVSDASEYWGDKVSHRAKIVQIQINALEKFESISERIDFEFRNKSNMMFDISKCYEESQNVYSNELDAATKSFTQKRKALK